ncbi:MAG: hypothetical protein ACLFQ5_06990 [Oceanicaulis sp.]
MSARPYECAALLLADPHSRRIALARRDGALTAPQTRLERSDGLADGPAPAISRHRLGCAESRARAFQDAALRAVYEELGQLIARPALMGERLPSAGGWGRLARHRLAPDRHALTYLGRALDPAGYETRRHMRVFAAPLARVSNSIKRRGRADRIVWITPENAAVALDDPALSPFLDLALSALGGRPRPLRVAFRAGQRMESRL